MGGEFFPPLLNNLKLRPKRALWDFQTLWLLTLAYCAHFCQFLCYPLQYFLIYDFFSKLCQTKIAIFRDFFIYNYRFRKKHFSVENNHNIMKLHKNVYFRVSFKVNKVFWKIGIFTRTGTIKHFFEIWLYFTLI